MLLLSGMFNAAAVVHSAAHAVAISAAFFFLCLGCPPLLLPLLLHMLSLSLLNVGVSAAAAAAGS
jgi:hypothetical protein